MVYAPITKKNPMDPENPHITQFSIYPNSIELDNGLEINFFKDNENFPNPYIMDQWEDGLPMLNDKEAIYEDISEVYDYCSHEYLKEGEVFESKFRKETYEQYVQNQDDWGEREEFEKGIEEFTNKKERTWIIRNYGPTTTSKLTFTFA